MAKKPATRPLELYRDESGDPRVRAAAGRELLANLLESDVQGSAALGQKILNAIDRVLAGAADEWERTGNAYTLTLSPKGATIQLELEEDAEALHLPLAELREAVARWIDFVAGD
jgi:uncharacterized protein YacL (UPF0231 family)